MKALPPCLLLLLTALPAALAESVGHRIINKISQLHNIYNDLLYRVFIKKQKISQ